MCATGAHSGSAPACFRRTAFAIIPGRNGDKLAEKMVSRKMLDRVLGIPGAYTLPGRM
jgi:hypothetical protein